MWQKSYDSSPVLYLIPTPIGNLHDITMRAIRVLNDVEVVFSEDTRVTRKLLEYYGIKKKLISLHDHNEEIVKEKVLLYLETGSSVGLVTDRGTPIISDPGYKTVKYVSEKGYNVVALPGANAFVPALIASGIAPLPFTFYGFLDSKSNKRRQELEALKNVRNTMIFYEAPHRIVQTMEMMLEVFGDRQVSLSREISKKYEGIYRGNIGELLPNLKDLKGEFVIVVSGFHEEKKDFDISDIDSLVNMYVEQGVSKMEAMKMVAKEMGIKKSDVYAIYHKKGNCE